MALGKGYAINSRKGRTDVNCSSESSVRKGWSDRVKDPVQRLYPIEVSSNQKDYDEHLIKVVKDKNIPAVVPAEPACSLPHN